MGFFGTNSAPPSGSLPVGGPGSSTDNAVVRWDGTTGQLLQDSLVTIDDLGVMTVPVLRAVDVITTGNNVIVLNDDVVGAPTEDAGIEVERGTSLNAQLLWNEAGDYWEAGDSGDLSRLVRYLELNSSTGPSGASLVGFDPSGTGLTSTDAQGALQELDSDLLAHTSDASIHFTEASIDHTNILNVGSNSHAQIDAHISAANAHIADTSIHFTEASIDHTAILNIGSNTHAQIDSQLASAASHIADTSIHFTQSNIDHTVMLNVGLNTHPQIDSHITTANAHIADSSIHYPISSIDHTALLNIGSNTHAQLDANVVATNAHIADGAIHFTQASIDHTNIANIGVNTHPQIDTQLAIAAAHIADGSIHYPQTSIDHTNLQNIGVNTHAQIDSHITTANSHIADTSIHFTETSIDHTNIQNVGVNTHAQIDAFIASAGTSSRAPYMFLVAEANINSTSFLSSGAIPWDQSSNSGYAAGEVAVALTASTNRDLDLRVWDVQAAASIGSTSVLAGTGFQVVRFTITNPTADTYLELQAAKSAGGGDNPTLHTAAIEFGF